MNGTRLSFLVLVLLFLFLAVLSASNTAKATERVEYSIIAGSWSYHHNEARDYEYNETHRSLGVLRTEDRSMVTNKGVKPYAVVDALFTFKNSFRKQAVAYLRSYEFCSVPGFFRLCGGAAGGLTTGYKDQTGLPVVPVAGLGTRFQTGPVQVQVLHIPFADVTAAQFSVRIYTR